MVDPAWLLAALFSTLVVPYSYKFTYSILFVGHAFLMAIAVRYGIYECVVAAAFYGIVSFVMNRSVGLAKLMLFSTSVCGAFLYAWAWKLIGIERSLRLLGIVGMAVAACMLTLPLIRGVRARIGYVVCPLIGAAAAVLTRGFEIRVVLLLLVPVSVLILLWAGILRRMKIETESVQKRTPLTTN